MMHIIIIQPAMSYTAAVAARSLWSPNNAFLEDGGDFD